MLSVQNLTKRFGGFTAVDSISFELGKGEILGLIGPNGSGKSTTLKLISRIISPTSGNIKVNGRVTALLELGAGFHPELSGRDNILLNGTVMGLSRTDIERKMDAIIDFAELEEFIDVPVKKFIEEINAYQPDVVGLSGFLTLAFDSMKETIAAFEQEGMRDKFKIMIGGGQIDETVRAYTGADAFGVNAVEAVNLCRNWMGVAA